MVLSDAYKTWFNSGYSTWDVSSCSINSSKLNSVTTFILPFPDTDNMNPHLLEDPIDVDIDQYNY